MLLKIALVIIVAVIAAGWLRRGRGAPATALRTAEAADILGITADASREEVVAAHRRLIRNLHPDRGGSDYLAQQINAARDTLLRRKP